jgi:hypothetical protein
MTLSRKHFKLKPKSFSKKIFGGTTPIPKLNIPQLGLLNMKLLIQNKELNNATGSVGNAEQDYNRLNEQKIRNEEKVLSTANDIIAATEAIRQDNNEENKNALLLLKQREKFEKEELVKSVDEVKNIKKTVEMKKLLQTIARLNKELTETNINILKGTAIPYHKQQKDRIDSELRIAKKQLDVLKKPQPTIVKPNPPVPTQPAPTQPAPKKRAPNNDRPKNPFLERLGIEPSKQRAPQQSAPVSPAPSSSSSSSSSISTPTVTSTIDLSTSYASIKKITADCKDTMSQLQNDGLNPQEQHELINTLAKQLIILASLINK